MYKKSLFERERVKEKGLELSLENQRWRLVFLSSAKSLYVSNPAALGMESLVLGLDGGAAIDSAGIQ